MVTASFLIERERETLYSITIVTASFLIERERERERERDSIVCNYSNNSFLIERERDSILYNYSNS